ncbi:amidohydrolase [Parafilimonas sp.]|uniref:amidohydrolase n=1 Tax=Parafilimonas sp. TaxID=1969739 RepID=UPI0039E49007
MKNIVSAMLAALLFAACSSKRKVDLIVYNGQVYTVDSAFSTIAAFAVQDGKIVATGTNDDITEHYTAPDTVNAGRQAVYPGFNDAHSHFISYGESLYSVDLFDCTSMDEVISRVQNFVQAHAGEAWIRGRGWDQNKFPGKAYPTNEQLNKLFPNTPVLLERVDGHAALANAKALAIAGIKPGQTIGGGSIETKNGALTGILIDNAMNPVFEKIPYPSREQFQRWLQAAQQNCFAQGLTTVSDCGISYVAANMIDTLQKEGRLNMRVYVLLGDDKQNYDAYLSRGPYKTGKLFIKGFKLYADGALGSRGACLLQPYNDKPGWYGFMMNSQAHYDSVASILAKTGFQMCTHAIGDSGNREILKIYNKYLQGKNDKRWRIEHAQIINPADFDLFGATSVIPSVQPTHATSDMYWATDRIGAARLKGGYALKALLQQNGWLPLGTDFPVEDISPFKTFAAAVFRQDAKGFPAGGFQMENALTREEAIRGMTIWAAKAEFLEKETGSLETGKKADFIILDKDLMKANLNDVLNTKVVSTYIDGKKVYGKK